MARLARFFAYLHSLVISVPQQGYHNISRVVQPQIRGLSESFIQATSSSSSRAGGGGGSRATPGKDTMIEMQTMTRPKQTPPRQRDPSKARG
jgi:hypothetical protein